ncbi:hypothetical protein AVEN_88052-1 [Araneus ventricosus]|uniref:Uncharacterized protein n=1 Tax=Araneus ventricosus TaxID=182803 RepID=A0A4Y1ZXH9_ARAVE|nr:hypothetical protein AVEN_88052-1 [Araneus ventricosus]
MADPPGICAKNARRLIFLVELQVSRQLEFHSSQAQTPLYTPGLSKGSPSVEWVYVEEIHVLKWEDRLTSCVHTFVKLS